jgi:hypothetical protein
MLKDPNTVSVRAKHCYNLDDHIFFHDHSAWRLLWFSIYFFAVKCMSFVTDPEFGGAVPVRNWLRDQDQNNRIRIHKKYPDPYFCVKDFYEF